MLLTTYGLHDPDALTAGATDGSRDCVGIGSGCNTVIRTEGSQLSGAEGEKEPENSPEVSVLHLRERAEGKDNDGPPRDHLLLVRILAKRAQYRDLFIVLVHGVRVVDRAELGVLQVLDGGFRHVDGVGI